MGEGTNNESPRKKPSRNSGTPPWGGNDRRGADGDSLRRRNTDVALPAYSEALSKQIERRQAAERLKLGIGQPNVERITTGGTKDIDKEH